METRPGAAAASSASSAAKGIEPRLRPVCTSLQSSPRRAASRAIGRIGVMPMPPAMSRMDASAAKGKAFRGAVTATRTPSPRVSCTSAEPPAPLAMRRTAMRYRCRSAGSPHREYCRLRPEGRCSSMWAPGCQGGSVRPSGAASRRETTSSASWCLAATTSSRIRGISVAGGRRGGVLRRARRVTALSLKAASFCMKESLRGRPYRSGGRVTGVLMSMGCLTGCWLIGQPLGQRGTLPGRRPPAGSSPPGSGGSRGGSSAVPSGRTRPVAATGPCGPRPGSRGSGP